MGVSEDRRGWLRSRPAGVAGMVVAAGMLASCGGAGAGTGPAPAAATAAEPCAAEAPGGGPRMPVPPRAGSLVVSYQLSGVAALSAASVWAVGTTASIDPMTMHWDGSAWSQVLTSYGDQTVNPGGAFQAVAAVSARDIWAVGDSAGPVWRWDGGAWSPSPVPAAVTRSDLQGVAGASPADVWAVGSQADQPVILHWDGRAWTIVPSPVPTEASTDLHGVAAVSAASAWAVGDTWPIGGTQAPLIEHWNGTAWTQVPSPAIPGGGILAAVAASSPTNAWAVGAGGNLARGASGLIEHWDGRAWTIVPSPDLDEGAGELHAVTIVPDGSAWAVGGALCPRQGLRTVVEHWDGRAWTIVPSPASGELDAVAAASPSSAWAVGYWTASTTAIIEHWNGTAWTWPPGFCAAPSGPGCYPAPTSSGSP